MSLKDNYKVFKLQSGEIIITEIQETDDEGMYILKYPAIIVPIPKEQSGVQNQIGFGMFMPFSDNYSDMRLNPISVMVDSDPHMQIKEAYIQWIQQIRSRESGIIIPHTNIPKSGQAGESKCFSQLNV